MNPDISAIQHLRPLRGGAQSHLMRASDGHFYVTKFQNNPQHVRVLANEMFATELGLRLGLPLPPVRVIEVSEWLIEHTPDLRIHLAGRQIPCHSGKQLGSLYVGGENCGMLVDYLPGELLIETRNLADFARVLVLDKWTCNCDGRQAVFFRKTRRHRRYQARFIDQGYCFNAAEWTFPDFPLRGVYANNCVYQRVQCWEDFEPALSQAESMDPQVIWSCAREIPEEWYEGDRAGLERLVEKISERRGAIRELISAFRDSNRNPESFMSCSHGAGRAMSRGEAKRRFTVEDHMKATAGVECRKDADVIDETPMAYKSIDAVMEAQRDLVDVVHTLRQVVCVKG